MKHILKSLSIVLCLFCTIVSALAQDVNFSMNETMGRRAAEKVAQMNDFISFMGDKKKSVTTRENYKKKALNLFVGNGYSYTENGVRKEGVEMETTSKNRRGVTHRLMRDYFEHLKNLRYSDVKITSTEVAAIKVSNLRKISDDTYVCTCQYDQTFVGYRDGRPAYKDITTKRCECYVTVEKTEEGVEYVVKLGNVTALETR